MNDLEKRAENWARIQNDAPDAVEFFTAINKVFGSPCYADVTIDGELIVLRSSLDYDRKLFNTNLR